MANVNRSIRYILRDRELVCVYWQLEKEARTEATLRLKLVFHSGFYEEGKSKKSEGVRLKAKTQKQQRPTFPLNHKETKALRSTKVYAPIYGSLKKGFYSLILLRLP